jgi:predicted TIM-barrel fold metal-dependent hydrolase
MTGWLDVHAHYATERYIAECQGAGHGKPDGMPGLPAWSVDAALDVMAATDVAAAVLSISSPGVHFGDDSTAPNASARALAAHVNDAGALMVARQPARFGLSAVLPLPDVEGSLVELARVYDELGADAIALETNFHGRYLTDPAFEPVLAELQLRAAVVTLHPTSPPCWEATALGRPRPMIEFIFDTTRCVVDLAFSGVLQRYPAIRWIVPHAGAALPTVAHRVAALSAITGEPVDFPAALRGLYYDLAGVPVPVALEALLAIVEPGRLLYGSDFPFTPAPVVSALAASLAQSPALRTVDLGITQHSPAAELFPRLAAAASPSSQ